MRYPEIVAAGFISGVKQGTIVQNNPHAQQGLVGVFGDPAAHAAGIVGCNPTDHGRLNGGRVGPNLPAIFQ